MDGFGFRWMKFFALRLNCNERREIILEREAKQLGGGLDLESFLSLSFGILINVRGARRGGWGEGGGAW